MDFRAAFTSAVRAVARPHTMLPAAFVAIAAVLSPPAVEDASAQGYGMQGSRGGSSGMGSGRSQYNQSGMTSKSSKNSATGGMGNAGRPYPNSTAGNHYPKSGMGNSGRPYPNSTAGNSYPKGGMGRPYPNGSAGNHYPKDYPKGGNRHPPRRYPIPPAVASGGSPVVAVPGRPSSAPPPSGGGGQQPPAQSSPPPTNWGRYVPNEVVVEFASSVSPQAITALLQRHRLTALENITLQSSGTSIRRLRINDGRSVPAVVGALAAEGYTVQPNLIATLQEAAPAMSQASAPEMAQAALEQYALARMRMPEAHALATGQRVRIAVIDSGADAQHPELAGMIVDSYDAIGSGDRTHAHGTSIVGAIVSRSRLRGTAPGAQILMARAFGTKRNTMDGNSVDIIKALEWSLARGPRIINMSFAGSRDPGIERRLATAVQRGIILVAAAGNAGPASPPLYPAANPAVIAVTATDIDDRIFRGANRGNHIAIAAPGVDLWLPTVDGGYRRTSGTSFSAAEITGIIALMLEHNPGLDLAAVRRVLLSTARDLGAPGIDPLFGAGLVDAYQAVSSVMPAAPEANSAPATVNVTPREVELSSQ